MPEASVLKEAIELQRRELQTDLWKLLTILYPKNSGHYWSETFHKPVCEFFVKKDHAKRFPEWDVVKQRLYLDPRNHFKTTIDICDMVQFVLCDSDIRIMIGSGTRTNAINMLGAVKSHFQYNPIIRYLFPELCPPADKVEDWGKMESFTCPARKNKSLREPTCSVASPDSTVAGMHYDVLKFDDLVNETNSRTPEGLKQVISWFKLTNPLLEKGGYRDVIGTRYDFSDLYGEIIGDDSDGADIMGTVRGGYKIFKRGCFDGDGNPLFPERFTREDLNWHASDMGTFLFACQYLNEPVPSDSQMFPLPLIEKAFIAAA